MKTISNPLYGWLCGGLFFLAPLVTLQLCAVCLLEQSGGAILVYNLLFSLLSGLAARWLWGRFPLLLGGLGLGLFVGLLALAFAFSEDTLGSYGLLRLFVILAVALTGGGVGELIRAGLRRRAARIRREEYLASLLYNK